MKKKVPPVILLQQHCSNWYATWNVITHQNILPDREVLHSQTVDDQNSEDSRCKKKSRYLDILILLYLKKF